MESREKRIDPILARLAQTYPEPRIALNFNNAYELIVATILSAQCTDALVNRVTPGLFRRYPRPQDLADARLDQLEDVIRSTGFYHNKARNLIGMAQVLRDRFHNQVPSSMDDLLALPGVARKTANVVMGGAFGKSEGVVVDTHVRRVSQRLGLTSQESPEKIEQDLMALIPEKDWIAFSLRVILHGRETCTAKAPACPRCPLQPCCPSAAVFMSKAETRPEKTRPARPKQSKA